MFRLIWRYASLRSLNAYSIIYILLQFEKALLTEIRQLEPEEKPNLLILGPVGAGKSSYINSILSIGKGRKCALASTGDTGDASWTLDVRFYLIYSLHIFHVQMSLVLTCNEQTCNVLMCNIQNVKFIQNKCTNSCQRTFLLV
jgi:hypothetical protein